MKHKKQPAVAGNLDDVSQPLKLLANIFLWHGYIYLVTCRLQRTSRTGFNYSIKILLAKITFLFWILLCYLLNMLSFCIGSISWGCFVITLFCCSSHVPLFRGIPIVLPVFRCSTSVPVFRQWSGVPCSGVPGFIVFHWGYMTLLM